jgi:hypothetical protein
MASGRVIEAQDIRGVNFEGMICRGCGERLDAAKKK